MHGVIPYMNDSQYGFELEPSGVASYSIYFHLHGIPLDLCTRVKILLLMIIYISVICTAVYLVVVIPEVILMSGIKMNNKSVAKTNVFNL